MGKKNIPDDDGDNGRELIEIKMQEKDSNRMFRINVEVRRIYKKN